MAEDVVGGGLQDPELSAEELHALALLPSDANGNVAFTSAQLAEIDAFAAALSGGRSGKEGDRGQQQQQHTMSASVMLRESGWRGAGSERVDAFHFGALMERLLAPEERAGGANAVAEALLEVRSARLDRMRMPNTDALECLTNLAHLHIEYNEITSLDGVAFMLGLTTLVAHHNRIESAEPVADLVRLTYLDLGHNRIAELDPDAQLPRSLHALVLVGNPVAPNYEDDEVDEEYAGAYRAAITARCSELRLLDGTDLGCRSLLQLATTAAQGGAEEWAEAAGAEAAAGASEPMEAAVCDADFIHDDERDEFDGRGDGRGARAGRCGSGGGGESDDESDDDDDGDLGRGNTPPPPPPPAAQPSDGRSGAPRAHFEVVPGLDSDVGRIAGGLIARYERAVTNKQRCVEAAVAGHADPTPQGGIGAGGGAGGDDEQRDEDVRQAADNQRSLRHELRAVQQHHARLAAGTLEANWSATAAALQQERDGVEARRAEQAERTSRPSAAYLRALEMLKKEAGVDTLDRFRKPRSVS